MREKTKHPPLASVSTPYTPSQNTHTPGGWVSNLPHHHGGAKELETQGKMKDQAECAPKLFNEQFSALYVTVYHHTESNLAKDRLQKSKFSHLCLSW